MGGFQEIGRKEAEGARWLFSESFGRLRGMDKAEHARRLRAAIATSTLSRADVAEATGKGYRTVSNWISEADPTMPSEADRAALRRLFPGYDQSGDPVELAIKHSRLTEDRQYVVLGTYKRELRLQDEEAERGRTA